MFKEDKKFDKSYFGKFKGLGKFKREEIDRICLQYIY
jgi:hypothetical protein